MIAGILEMLLQWFGVGLIPLLLLIIIVILIFKN